MGSANNENLRVEILESLKDISDRLQKLETIANHVSRKRRRNLFFEDECEAEGKFKKWLKITTVQVFRLALRHLSSTANQKLATLK